MHVCVKESKRHSQGAVSRESGSRLITGLQCVWSLPGTDSFSPHGNPLPSPLLSKPAPAPLYIIFLFPPCFSPLPIDSGSMQKHTGALLGLLALPKQGFVRLERHLLIRVSVNTNMMSCHLSLFDILADIQSCALGGKRAQKADPQPWDGWVYGY